MFSFFFQLDLGLGMNPYSGPGLGGITSPASPASMLNSSGFSGLQAGSQFSGPVSMGLEMGGKLRG